MIFGKKYEIPTIVLYSSSSRSAATQLSFLTKTLGIAEEFSVKTTWGAICWTKHSSALTHLRAPQEGAEYFFGLNFTLFASLTSIFTNNKKQLQLDKGVHNRAGGTRG